MRSLLFSRNLTAFVSAFTKDQGFQLDFNDDIQQAAVITHDGEVKHEPHPGSAAKNRDLEAEWISGRPCSSSCWRRSSGWA